MTKKILKTLKPCPFCGGKAYIDACDRIIQIGCDSCNYHMHFPGILRSKDLSPDSPVVNDTEVYYYKADEDAIEKWNTRACEKSESKSEPEKVNTLGLATAVEVGKFLSQGKGIIKHSDGTCCTSITCNESSLDDIMELGLKVRAWDDPDWHEPTTDYLEKFY